MARITLVVALMAALVMTSFTTAHGETLTEGSGDRALLSLPEVNEGRELLGVGGIRADEVPTYVGRKLLYNYVGTRAAEAPVSGRKLLYNYVGTRAAEAPVSGRKLLYNYVGTRAAEAPFAGAAEAPAYGRKMLAVGGIRAAYAPAPSGDKDAAVSTGIFP